TGVQTCALPISRRFRAPGDAVGRHRSGAELEIELVVSQMSLVEAEQLVAIVRDISERKRQQSQLEFMATHDVLTGLPNRKHFERLVMQSRASGEAGALAFVDLDDFKLDRKSTRLNSSHVKISYAVFCLK